MNVWKSNRWINILDIENHKYRSGLRLIYQKNIDCEVKRATMEFANWLRNQYVFPIRVPIYFKSSKFVKTQDRDLVSAKIFEPIDRKVEPYISIATGEISEVSLKVGKDNALAGILGSMIHELTHYFQWVNGIDLSDRQAEKQANYYRSIILEEYSRTREHP